MTEDNIIVMHDFVARKIRRQLGQLRRTVKSIQLQRAFADWWAEKNEAPPTAIAIAEAVEENAESDAGREE